MFFLRLQPSKMKLNHLPAVLFHSFDYEIINFVIYPAYKKGDGMIVNEKPLMSFQRSMEEQRPSFNYAVDSEENSVLIYKILLNISHTLN